MAERLPCVLITGASGFIGRHLVDAAKEKYRVIGLARRSQKEAGIEPHPNISWRQLDIGALEPALVLADELAGEDVRFIIHLAGYYDFSNRRSPEYERTNIHGTHNMLEVAKRLAVERFAFASSVTVTDYRRHPAPLTERSPADADFPYAISKRAGETLCREYAPHIPCSVVRIAAVFSDWCEYGPLYMLLSTWFSSRWNARIIGGHGRTSIPFIHVNNLCRFFLCLLERSSTLKPFDIFLASPPESSSHHKLFKIATRLSYGRARHAICVPKPLAALGILLRRGLGFLLRRPPFERFWMVKYIDRRLTVDPSYTRRHLPYPEKARLVLERRLLFMLENLKRQPMRWHSMNADTLKRSAIRPRMAIAAQMESLRAALVAQVQEQLVAEDNAARFPNYRAADQETLRLYVDYLYGLLLASVRSTDRMPLLEYMHYLAVRRCNEGFALGELRDALIMTSEVIVQQLAELRELQSFDAELNDAIRLTMELASDEAAEAFGDELPAESTHPWDRSLVETQILERQEHLTP